ncbi:MAG: DUF1080 domain-containing protein [Verrucomicrobiae bacterium]|nr:DUF1080 domain-containing protein [Verrucomicrobiae bacterium]
MKPLVLALALCLLAVVPARAADTLAALVRILGGTPQPQLQLDILRGLRDATQGRPELPMPDGWEAIEARLARSDVPEIRSLSRSLGLTFGSASARLALRVTLQDRSVDPAQRQEALRALLGVRDPELPPVLRALLTDPAVRAAAVRALATFEDPQAAPALLAVYPSLSPGERRDALNTLAARATSARILLDAVAEGTVSPRDITAEILRQLRSLKDDSIDTALTRVYGPVRDVAADKQAEIERYRRIYRAGGSTPGDALRGRVVYARLCQQCHVLFDSGGKVGPDLTGSARNDLEYVLQNIIDPNAVIPNEYLASTFELRDGRVVTGLVQRQDDRTLTVATATETLTLPRADIVDTFLSQLSMMPEGLIDSLADQEFRDLIYYLGRPGQVPLLATPETAPLFFNGRDLELWDGDDSHWRVEEGQLVGRAHASHPAPDFLRSEMIASDFVLRLQFQLQPDAADAAILFRAESTPDGGATGYRLQLGSRNFGRLTLTGSPAPAQLHPAHARPALRPWNTLEIRSHGNRLHIALNGQPHADLESPAGPRQGLVAFELPPAAAELRLKDLALEPAPPHALTPDP